MADPKGKDAVKLSTTAINQVASGQLDLAGFRMGKQRLVSKKKRKSGLKKVILDEREYNRGDPGDIINKTEPGARPTNAVIGGLSLDAPEFVPSGWDFSGFTSIAGQGIGPIEPETSRCIAAQEGQPEVSAADPAVAASVGAAADIPSIFLPSWCQGPSTADASASGGAAVGTADSAADAASAAEGLVGDTGGRGDRSGGAAPSDASGPDIGAAAVDDEDGTTGGQGEGGGNISDGGELLVAAAIERLRAVQEGKKRQPEKKDKQKQGQKGSDLEVRHYVHQVLNDDLDEKVKLLLGELGRYQDRTKERDPLKYQKQKRFCVGMREAQRTVARGKAKGIVCAPNLEECSAEGGLDDTVEDLIEACREADVPVIFALSRNRIGKALGKNIRLSIICILSAEGVHQEFKQVLKLTDDLRRQWVVRQMANFSSEDAEAAIKRAEQRAARDAGRREMKANLEAERKEEEERKRAEAKAAKEAEKARRQAAHQAEMERRRALKAVREEAEKEAAEVEAGVAKHDALQKADEERKRKVKEAANCRLETARRAEEEKRREAEEAAAQAVKSQQKAAAAEAGEVAEESDAESDSSGSSVPLGFNAALF